MILDDDSISVMLNAAPICGSLWTRAGHSIDCNSAALRLFGLRAKQEWLDHQAELSPPQQPDGADSGTLWLAHLHQAFAEGRVEFSWSHRQLGGGIIPTRITLTRVDHGTAQHVVAFAVKQVDARTSDTDPNSRNARAHLMLDNAPIACTFWDLQGQLIDCNDEALRLFGLDTKEEFLVRYAELVPEFQPQGGRSAEMVRGFVDAAHASGRYRFPHPWIRLTTTGEPIPCELTLALVTQDGEPMVVAFLRDLREINEVLRRIHQANEYTQLMLDATPLCCNLWDEAHNNIACNQEAVKLFNLANKQEYLDRFLELSPEYQPSGALTRDLAQEHIAIAFSEGYTRFEWMHQKLNGDPLPAEITLVRVARGDGFIVAGYTRDLRELKQSIASLKRLESLAYTDRMTKTANRHYFTERATATLRDIEPGGCVSLLIFDIDHFKGVNDTYGHTAGDAILRGVADRVHLTLRGDDLFARYGGEEFVILLSHSRLTTALSAAERIRKVIAREPFDYQGQTIPITVSIGVASCSDPSAALTDFINEADTALYEAKHRGRNRVESLQALDGLSLASARAPEPPA